MASSELTIINKLGLHARAASRLVQTTSRFGCSIRLSCKGKTVDGKSIMAVMMLAAAKGTLLTVETSGKDEIAALEAIRTLIENRFDEAE